jgi:TolB-like protein/DNA-binding winged helix-turn-helix (wHTH) protein/Tfp pilus assembly protein PilF
VRGGMGLVRDYRFGPFELRTSARELFKNGTKVRLRGQPYLILEVLLERAGSAVSREEIKEKLWPADTFVDFEHGLNTSVKKLRQVLCDSADEPRYIETVPRLGYRFIAPVEIVPEAVKPAAEANAVELAAVSEAAIEKKPDPNQFPPSQPTVWRLLSRGLLAAALLGVFFFGVFAENRMGWPFDSSRGLANTSQSAKRFNSIAVLPLENLSSDPAQEYFADGITDELITDLAQLGGLRVISRTSVMHYKAGNKIVPQIGRERGVDAVIEGTVERVADRVKIRVQLIDTANDRHLWAHSYNREFKDVLILESTVAHDIADEVEVQTGQPRVQVSSATSRMVQPEAYDAYLKGHYFRNQRSEAGLKKSIECFEEAIAKDPTFAAGYAGLAGSYLLMGSDVLPAKVAREKARDAAARALELDPESAEAHAAMGMIAFYYEWNWEVSEREFRRAIELNPGYVTGHQWYSYYLRAMGRLPEALQEAKQAQQLDPLSLQVNTTMAGRYRDLGQYDQAIALSRQTLELDPNFAPAHEMLASSYEEQGKFPSAILEWEKAAELSQDNPGVLASLGHAYGLSGRQTEARKIVARLEQISKQHYVAAWDMAVLFTGLGDSNDAFRCLERSYQERESQMPFLMQDHRLTTLRGDRRFQSLLRRVGLTA